MRIVQVVFRAAETVCEARRRPFYGVFFRFAICEFYHRRANGTLDDLLLHTQVLDKILTCA